jgi:hypothetical protein
VDFIGNNYFFLLQGNDLFNVNKVVFQNICIRKQETLKNALRIFSSQLKLPLTSMRLWPVRHRINQVGFLN